MIEQFYTGYLTSDELDFYLSLGFRHFGIHFYRYDVGTFRDEKVHVLPLRINLANYKKSKSQKKIWNKNQNFKIKIEKTNITEEINILFDKHKNRFKEYIPDSIYTFINQINPHEIPCEMNQVIVLDKEKIIAVSFLDIGNNSTSSIYGMFDPDYEDFSLGIYTMLLEIEFSIQNNKIYYYPGYAYIEPSFYDYKKQFFGLENLNYYTGKWLQYERNFSKSLE